MQMARRAFAVFLMIDAVIVAVHLADEWGRLGNTQNGLITFGLVLTAYGAGVSSVNSRGE